ncbi:MULTISPECIES: hypothetical protein [Burkholderia]|uniref:hypothetical protein n=1 Tax=Burkholderia TaxID=32008 RepID=UPI00075A7ADB|nr:MULTISPECIES: hypothetical protein [Burkholderia]KVF27007.1 hypothetical protein WJ08_26010 [Burkholderia vietnamiensis]KVF39671.1 hypothetical protein WJ10_20375 [Burkholderia vietnamiensis]UVS96818.1 hypothetical protein EFP19_14385 [Burkholderia glumae]HDR9241419.1 hypothetical protein [Burkholderia vietnamiensis]
MTTSGVVSNELLDEVIVEALPQLLTEGEIGAVRAILRPSADAVIEAVQLSLGAFYAAVDRETQRLHRSSTSATTAFQRFVYNVELAID